MSFHALARTFFVDDVVLTGQLAYIKSIASHYVDILEELLFRSADDALSSMGEPLRQAFLWHLKHEGIPFSHSDMDINQIEFKLREFFGVGSPIIMRKIFENFMTNAMAEGYFSTEMISRLYSLPKNSNVEKILRLVTE